MIRTGIEGNFTFPISVARLPVSWLLRRAILLACLLPVVAHAEPPTRIAGTTYLGDLPTLIAERQDLFQAQGIEARVEYSPSGRMNLDKLRQGEVDFALMALTPLVIDWLSDTTPGQGDDPVILASLVHSTRLNQVVTLAGRDIESARDLTGHRVALEKGTNAEFVWWLFAHYHGLSPTAVTLQDRPIRQVPRALLAQEADAAIIWEPWTTHLREQLDDRLQIFPHSNVYTAKWVVVTHRRTAAQDARHSSRVLAAYRTAIDYIDRHPDQALSLYADHVDLPPPRLPDWEQTLNFQLGLDWSLISTLQQQFDWARQAGYAGVAPLPDILSLIDAGPLGLVAPMLVDIPVDAVNE